MVPADRSSIEQAWQAGETATEHMSTATPAQ